jgi:hypothetical protein
MYLLILEDGEIVKSATVNEDDKLMVDAGLLDLIDVSGDQPVQYLEGEWHEIDGAAEQ